MMWTPTTSTRLLPAGRAPDSAGRVLSNPGRGSSLVVVLLRRVVDLSNRNGIPRRGRGRAMKRLLRAPAALAAAVVVLAAATGAARGGALGGAAAPSRNVAASTPTAGGGYPVPPGSRVPLAGTCGPGPFNANHSESWLAVKPGTEDLVGTSKFFFDKYSTFYM